MSGYGEGVAPASMAASDEFSVQLMFLSGELAWGPQPVNLSATVGDLTQTVAKHVGKPSIAIRLLSEATVLDTEATLSSLGIVSEAGPLTLQCTIDAMLTEIQDTFDKFLVFFSDLNAGKNPITDDRSVVSPSAVDAKLKEISAAASLDSLPAEVAAWLRVLLCTGKAFIDFKDDVVFQPREFQQGVGDILGTEGGGGVASGGLIYLSIFGDNDNVLFWIIDAGGELAKMNGEEGTGAVYFAETWDDIWDAEGALTAAFWQKARDNDPGEVTIEMLPKRVAGSVTDLFTAWMANGGIPGGRRGK